MRICNTEKRNSGPAYSYADLRLAMAASIPQLFLDSRWFTTVLHDSVEVLPIEWTWHLPGPGTKEVTLSAGEEHTGDLLRRMAESGNKDLIADVFIAAYFNDFGSDIVRLIPTDTEGRINGFIESAKINIAKSNYPLWHDKSWRYLPDDRKYTAIYGQALRQWKARLPEFVFQRPECMAEEIALRVKDIFSGFIVYRHTYTEKALDDYYSLPDELPAGYTREDLAALEAVAELAIPDDLPDTDPEEQKIISFESRKRR